jgi:transposase
MQRRTIVDAPRKTYRPWNPDTYRQQTHSPLSKLPQNDLVFFLLDVVPQLDLSALYAPYEDQLRGAPPFDPRMMTCLWLYAYSVGVFSSRKIAKACERNLAFLAIVGDDRPDFRTISDFRKIHLDALAELFHQVLKLAHEAGLVQLGAWATDGSKFPGNASRHKAMSYGYMQKEEERLKAEIAELLKQQQQVDEAEDATLGTRRGDELPEELAFREQRLAKILEAKKRLEEQAKAKAEQQQQQWQEEEAERLNEGKKPREPKTFSATPEDKAQTNFTDPDLKIMPQNNKSFEYSGNAQVVVDDVCQIIVAYDVVIETNDKQQAVPMAEKALDNLQAAGIERPVDAAGAVQKIAGLADSGYFSEKAVAGLEALGIDPYMPIERQKHHAAVAVPPSGRVTLTAAVEAEREAGESVKEKSAKEKMRAKMQTERGRAVYALRKGVVEPVFGQIKGARGFRRFSLRGLEKIRGEWGLVCLTHNLLKIWRYHYVPGMN